MYFIAYLVITVYVCKSW